MNDLDWLVQHRLQSLIRREYDWVFLFDGEASLVVGCLWRLVEDGRIRFTSEDDGHRFGLSAPLEVAVEVNRRIAGASVKAVTLQQGTLDLELLFNTGHLLQIIPASSGYEAWSISKENRDFTALGGGSLYVK